MLKKSDKKFILQILLLIVIGIIITVKIDSIGAFASSFLNLLRPLFVGIMLALILNRPIEYLKIQLRKVSYFNSDRAKVPAIIITYILFSGLIIGLFLIMIPQFIDSFGEFVSQFDTYSKTFVSTTQKFANWVDQYNIDPKLIEGIGDRGLETVGVIVKSLPNVLSKFVSGTVSIFASFFLGLIISIYVLLDKKRLKRQFLRVTSAIIPPDKQSRFNHIYYIIQGTFSSYFYIQLTEGLILGALFFIGMTVLGFPYALIISVFNGLSVLIPVVGAWVGAIGGGVIVLFTKPSGIFLYGIFVVLMQLTENNLIYPRRVKNSVGLPQIWVIVAITVGGGLFGVLGALLAVPVASIIYQLTTEFVRRKEHKRRLVKNEKLQETYQALEEIEAVSKDNEQ